MRPCIQELCIQEAVYPGAVAGEAPSIFTALGAG
jgi:hypothetical protein